jgi:isocitrate dehydrogenase
MLPARFMKIFSDVYEAQYKGKYEAAGIWYEHRLIDDMVAQVGSDGWAWLCVQEACMPHVVLK